MKRTRMFLGAVAVCLTAGCASHWVSIEEKSPGAETFTPAVKKGTEVACLSRVTVMQNGVEVTPNQDWIKRFSDKLRDTQVMSTLTNDHNCNGTSFNLTVSNTIDSHQGANATKGFFIGATLFLLTPALPLNIDFSSEMTLDATRPNGTAKRYTAKSAGSAWWHYFGNNILAGQELGSTITNNNTNAVMNQVVADSDFYNVK